MRRDQVCISQKRGCVSEPPPFFYSLFYLFIYFFFFLQNDMQECPVCGNFINTSSLEVHASACAASAFND